MERRLTAIAHLTFIALSLLLVSFTPLVYIDRVQLHSIAQGRRKQKEDGGLIDLEAYSRDVPFLNSLYHD